SGRAAAAFAAASMGDSLVEIQGWPAAARRCPPGASVTKGRRAGSSASAMPGGGAVPGVGTLIVAVSAIARLLPRKPAYAVPSEGIGGDGQPVPMRLARMTLP